MKKYLFIPILLTTVLIWSLIPGSKPGERHLSFVQEKPTNNILSKKIYSEENLRKDFQEIKTILITNHPAPYQFSGKDVFDKFYNDQLKKINHPMNLGEYFLIAAPLVEAIHCGHTWIGLPDDFWDNEEKIFFPVGLIFSGNKAYAAASPDIKTIPEGSEIISINKVPVSHIIESTKRLVNSDAKSSTGKLANFAHSFPDLFALQYGNHDSYEVNFIVPESSETKVQTIRPVSRNMAWQNPINTLSGSFAPGNELKLELLKDQNLAVMGIATFGYYDNQKKFYNFIDSAFEQINKASVKNLILDLRNNGGGDPVCASKLLSYIETKPAPYFVKIYKGYEALAKPLPLPVKNAFGGKLYVLINGGCFSSTGHLCALLKYLDRATFIGEETGGTYECNDDHVSVQTTTVHLNLNVARRTYTTAVKGISRDTGIMPDYPVEPSIRDVTEGKDAVRQYAINLVAKNQQP